ncbi:hypothetical protein OROHE_014903 [Orobanche hederae]
MFVVEPLIHFRYLVIDEFSEDMFVVERSELIHDICMLSWKSCRSMSKTKSNIFRDIINARDLVDWLMQAYVLCREVRDVFKKVFRRYDQMNFKV